MNPLDGLWTEHRAELAQLLDRLSSEQALEVLHIVIAQCDSGEHLGAMLAGTITGRAERRGGNDVSTCAEHARDARLIKEEYRAGRGLHNSTGAAPLLG